MGVSGGGFVSLLGTSSNDLTSALFVLGSMLGVLYVRRPEDAHTELGASLRWQDYWPASGSHLKYTSAVFAPGLGIVATLAACGKRPLAR